MDPAEPQQLFCPPENLEVSGNSSACPTKMGEGGNGPSFCLLPKVGVRPEDDPQKTDLNEPTSKKVVELKFQKVFAIIVELMAEATMSAPDFPPLVVRSEENADYTATYSTGNNTVNSNLKKTNIRQN